MSVIFQKRIYSIPIKLIMIESGSYIDCCYYADRVLLPTGVLGHELNTLKGHVNVRASHLRVHQAVISRTRRLIHRNWHWRTNSGPSGLLMMRSAREVCG